MTERQADQRWVEDARALYEARASREARLEDMGLRTGWYMADLHASIVGPDGKVGAIDPSPLPGWVNRGGVA